MGTTIAPPNEIIIQRNKALENANRIRIGRAVMLKRIRSLPVPESMEELADAVEDPPDTLSSLSIAHLLMAGRRVGERGVTVILRRAGMPGPAIPSHTSVGWLTDHQREMLADVLRSRATRARRGD